MPKATESLSTSRRRLLGRAALAAPAVALSLPALAAEAPDPHHGWWAAVGAIEARDGIRTGRTDEEVEADVDESVRLEELIGDTPAATLAGALVQLRLVARSVERFGMPSEREEAALASAIGTLDALSGRA